MEQLIMSALKILEACGPFLLAVVLGFHISRMEKSHKAEIKDIRLSYQKVIGEHKEEIKEKEAHNELLRNEYNVAQDKRADEIKTVVTNATVAFNLFGEKLESLERAQSANRN